MRSGLRVALIALLFVLGTPRANAQRSLTTTPNVYDFQSFAGAGFEPVPIAGELSSNEFQVLGGGSSATVQCPFGATCNTAATVFTRGLVAAPTTDPTTGGVYAFQPMTGEYALGVQPSGSSTTAFFTSPAGTITIAYVNGTGATLTTITTSMTTWVHNNADRSSTVTATFSTTGATPTTAMITTLTTPAANTGTAWASTPFSGSVDVSALAIGPGATFYLVLSVLDAGGSGSRDEVAWDDITVSAPAPSLCGNGVVNAGEACDAGAMNGATPCGCQSTCAYGAAGTTCGAAGGACDAAHTCDGAGHCAAHLAATGTECRASAGLCDPHEVCDGVTPTCPADLRSPAGTMCRAAIGLCDTAGICDGTSAACPADVAAPNGTSCSDMLFCNGMETCNSGTCTPGTPFDCSDMNACTTDTCAESSSGATCSHAPIAGCCNPSDSCDDGNACTADACSGVGGTCMHSPISGCCTADAQCTGSSACTTMHCMTNRCVSVGVAGCCTTDGDCASSNLCVTTHCVAGTCTSTPVGGCCNLAGDCDDHDACTVDACSHAGGMCLHDPIADCCNGDADCNDAVACTIDHCDLATHACHHDAAACMDGGVLDAGLDASVDGGAMDANVDGGSHDASQADGSVDTGAHDVAFPDTNVHFDAPFVDAARTTPHPMPSCGCRTARTDAGGLAVLTLLALALASRRRVFSSR